MNVLLALIGILVVPLSSLVGYHALNALSRRDAYLASGLGPQGSGSAVKDLAAFALLSLPRFVRHVTTGPIVAEKHATALEGYHQRLQLNQMGASAINLTDSAHYAENFYFWASLPGNRTDFVLSTRLSFFGRGGAHVVPWFSFAHQGEQWNLPDEFESRCEPHDHAKDPRVGRAPGLGELYFEVEAPLKRWTLSYKGVVQNEKTGAREQVDAKFELEFSNQDVFMYQIHWDEMAAALSAAQKPWTAQFWRDLRSQNQERYASRSHRAKGRISFSSGKPDIVLPELLSSRDHNWGIRDWLYIYRYLWWPPIHFATPLVIDGVAYAYFLGSFVEYGLTFSDLIVGGLVADDGRVASFSGATPLREIAPEWFDATSQRGKGIGAKLVPAQQSMTFGLLESTYALHVRVVHRGPPLWQHSFMLIDGQFEIHEAQAQFEISVTRMGSKDVIARTTAQGLWEFGAPLVKGDWMP